MVDWHGDEERLLVQSAQANNAEAFGVLFERHVQRAFAAAVAILGNREDAEDAVQDAAIEAYRSIKQLTKGEAFRAWFSRIAVNKAIDRLRKRRRMPVISYSEQILAAPFVDREAVMDLAQAIERLAPEHRIVIGLYYIAGYSTPEIASLLNKPEGTIRRRLSDAYSALRRILGSEVDHKDEQFRA
jgi:RNA polymerase sigma-70 factor (ECF subfamily)